MSTVYIGNLNVDATCKITFSVDAAFHWGRSVSHLHLRYSVFFMIMTNTKSTNNAHTPPLLSSPWCLSQSTTVDHSFLMDSVWYHVPIQVVIFNSRTHDSNVLLVDNKDCHRSMFHSYHLISSHEQLYCT